MQNLTISHTILAGFGCLFAVQLSANSPLPFIKAEITQVVNEVSIIQNEDLSKQTAEVNQIFEAPDVLETGRRSRAELRAEDGTITRVGSNTLFSFEPTKREINLERGSVLFHSPKGKGGGQIITGAATASVVGTTIIVAATTDGGFKVLCLEGRARISFGDGQVRELEAGQMTFVLPRRANTRSGLNNQNQGAEDSDPEGGQPGPVLNFDLSKITPNSTLLNGFSNELPSIQLIETESNNQQILIKAGDLGETQLVILGANKEELILGSGSVIENAINSQQSSNADQPTTDPAILLSSGKILSLGSALTAADSLSLSSLGIPGYIEITTDEFLAKSPYSTEYYGLVEGSIHFTDSKFDVSSLGLSPEDSNVIDIAAFEEIYFTQGFIRFTGLDGFATFRLTAPSIYFEPLTNSTAAIISLESDGPLAFIIDTTSNSVLTNGTIENPFGSIHLLVREGDLTFEDFSMLTTDSSNYGSNLPSSVLAENNGDIKMSANGNISIIDSTFGATNSEVSIGHPQNENTGVPTPKEVLIKNSDFYTMTVSVHAQNNIKLSDLELTQIQYFNAEANTISLDNVDFESRVAYLSTLATTTSSNYQEIRMQANTLNLADVNFQYGSRVHLASRNGKLNFGSSKVDYVNFVRNVTYGGVDAGYYVRAEDLPAGADYYTYSGMIDIAKRGEKPTIFDETIIISTVD